MKKLLSLVLICAMGLGMVSCVESEESPSVEAIRNAKAEQLKALSNFYNAQAEAEKIVANADAAYKNAQAEYQKAQAANQNAQAEAKKAEMERLNAQFAVELERIKAEAEAAIKLAELNAAQWEEDILAMANQKINDLYDAYKSYAGLLAQANFDLISVKMDLAQYEAGIISDVDASKQTIADKKAEIAKLNAKLAVLEDSEYATIEDEDSLEIEKLKALRAWYEADQAYKANEKAAMTAAKKVADDLQAAFDEAKGEINSSAMIVDKDAEGKYISVKVSEAGLAALTAPVSNYEDLEEAVEDAEEALEAAEAAVVDANAFATAAAPVLAANQTALVALAKAWDAYNGVGGSAAADVATAKADMEAAKDVFKVDSTNLSNEEKYMAALEALVPQIEEHATTMKAAADAVKAAKKAWDAAIEATGKAQAKVDTISAKCDAVVAQTLKTDLSNAQLDEAIAKKAYDAAVSSEDLAKAKYGKFIDETNASKALGSRIAFDKTKTTENVTAIKNEVKKVDVNIYNYEIKLLASTEAYNDAKAEYDELAAGVVTGGTATAAAALVVADSTAKATIAAVEKLMEDNEDLIEDLGIVFTTATQVKYKENKTPYTKDLYQLIDENKDGAFDFTINSNGVFTTTYANKVLSTPSLVTDLEDLVEALEAAVLEAKDDLTVAENALAKGEEGVDNDAYRASVKAAIEALNAQIPALNEAIAAYDAAYDAAEEAEDAVEELKGIYEGFEIVATGNDIYKEVKKIKDAIAKCEKEIAEAEAALAEVDAELESEIYQLNVANYKSQIAQLEAEVEYLDGMVQRTKAELDAAVAAQQAE